MAKVKKAQVAPKDETKADKFRRLARARVPKALKAIGNIGNLYSSGVTYLRKADQERFERTWFRRTQTWIGAPTGPTDANGNNYIYWDPDLYNVISTSLQYPPVPAGP